MRLKFAVPAIAGGLVLGWAGVAAADASPPPAAPIFYCPSSPAAKPAPGAQACPAAAPPQHVAVAERRRPPRHRREMRVVERPRAHGEDVSASQAFIYRYEQAEHGLDARAADEAWAHGGPPPCRERAPGCRPHHEWAEAPPPPPQVIVEQAPPQPQQVIVERAPPPPPQVIIERAPPPPPKIIIEHPPAPPPQIVFERAPAAPPQVIYERAPACPDRCPPPAAYGWQDRSEGAGYRIERHESERAGGWSYSEQNGRGQYQAWGNAPRRRPCPPSVPDYSCSGSAAYASGAYASGQAEWRDGSYGAVYPYAGRDAYGYLVWPGKTGP